MVKKFHFNKYAVGLVSLFLLTYLGGIWQRPIFLCEFAAIIPGLENAACFWLRLPFTLAALAAAGLFGYWGKQSSGDREFGVLVPTVLLLTPAVYLTITMPGVNIPPLLLIGGTLPWCIYLPLCCRGMIKGFRNMPVNCRNSGFALAAAGIAAGLLTGWWIAVFPALCWFFSYGVLQGIRSKGSGTADRAMMILSGTALSAAIVIFVIHIAGRFGIKYFDKLRFYSPDEFFAAPVLAFIVSAVWWRMAAKVEADTLRKFFYFCVGAAFPLLALHGAFPHQTIRQYAPENFLRHSIGKVYSDDTLLIADRKIAPALQRVCRSKVMILEDMTPEKTAGLLAERKSDAAIVCSAPGVSNKRFPASTRRWRSGKFTVNYWGSPKIIIKEQL